jgi:hypothetical protein
MNANLTAQAPETADVVVELTDGKSPCNCSEGCPGLTTRFFSQGHDARLVTRLRAEVLDGKLTTQEAFDEIVRRGGTERLQFKLDMAVLNARKPKAKTAKKGRKAAKAVVTFDLDGFTLNELPDRTEELTAKVGRWEYVGKVSRHAIVEEGATAEDWVEVFRYTTRKGEEMETTQFMRAKTDGEFRGEPVDEPEVPADDLPINAFANRVATPVQRDADIPF